MDFIEAERRYGEAKRKYDAGTLSAGDFDALLRELMVQDEKGRWWAKSRDTGDWNTYDNATGAWIVSKPPIALPPTPAAPADLPPAHGAASAARPRRKEEPAAPEKPEPAADFMPPVQLGPAPASEKPAAERPVTDEFVAPASGQPLIQPAAESESFMPPIQLGPTPTAEKPAAAKPASAKPAAAESFMPPVQLEQEVLPAEPVRPVAPRPPITVGAVGPTPIGAGMSLLIYIASFLIPIVGIVVFFLFRTRPADSDKRVARVALILGVVSILLGCLCSGGFMLLGGGGGGN